MEVYRELNTREGRQSRHRVSSTSEQCEHSQRTDTLGEGLVGSPVSTDGEDGETKKVTDKGGQSRISA